MKFALAAGILAKTLPIVLSENEAVDHLTIQQLVGQEPKIEDLASILTRGQHHGNKNLRAAANGGRSNQARGRSFLQGSNSNSNKDEKTGHLMNEAVVNNEDSATNKNKPCNPISKDPDVGILSCGKGMYCKEDETSSLGGECAPAQGPMFGDSPLLFGGGTLQKEQHRAVARRRLGRNKLNHVHKSSILRNRPEESHDVVECDPLAEVVDADVGILRMRSCEEGQVCLPSKASSMGGACYLLPEDYSSRMLDEEEAGVCPYWNYYPGNCDYDCYGGCAVNCTGFDRDTGNGVITWQTSAEYCLGIYRYPGCGDRCLTVSTVITYTDFLASSSYTCNDFSKPYAHKRCYEENFETETCTYFIDGVACDSCEVVSDAVYLPVYYGEGGYNGTSTACTSLRFDCGNTGGGAGHTFWFDGFQFAPIIESCYQPGPHPVCILCPEEGTVFNNDTYYDRIEVPGIPGVPLEWGGTFYCAGLYYLSYDSQSVMEDYCPAISAATADGCCILSDEEDTDTTADPTLAPTTSSKKKSKKEGQQTIDMSDPLP